MRSFFTTLNKQLSGIITITTCSAIGLATYYPQFNKKHIYAQETATKPIIKGMCTDRLQRIGNWMDSLTSTNKLAGASIAVIRQNKLVYEKYSGCTNIETQQPLNRNTLFRIFSMTKPITCIALMMLYEEGKFKLTDPVSKYIPTFGQIPGIYDYEANKSLDPDKGDLCVSNIECGKIKLKPQTKPMLIWHLLSHTSGLSYMLNSSGTLEPVDKLYSSCHKFHGGHDCPDLTLEQVVDKMATLPLIFEPGTQWCYSFSTDIVGRLVEVISGVPLDQFLYERIFKPLGMENTAFYIEDKYNSLNIDDLMVLYHPSYDPKDDKAYLNYKVEKTRWFPEGYQLNEKTKGCPMGGGSKGGLLSTLGDYTKFCQMLVNGGKNMETGEQIISPKIIQFMTKNHLPNNCDCKTFGNTRSIFLPSMREGYGFGFGFGVYTDNTAGSGCNSPVTPGAYGWGGAAGTTFWIDPVEDLIVIFMTQLLIGGAEKIGYDAKGQLEQFVYSAMVESYVNKGMGINAKKIKTGDLYNCNINFVNN